MNHHWAGTSGPPRNNLPLSLTSFVGRETAVAATSALLETSRLVTLTGAGGIGKTRLALAVAHAVEAQFPQGIWMVDLAPVRDPALVVGAVAGVVAVRDLAGRPLLDTLKDVLQRKRLLLVLDNCEHVVAACAEVADQLLGTCAELRILATSRQSLGIAGEVIWRVPSLGVPDRFPVGSVHELLEFAAVRLLVERAQAVLPSFALTSENAESVVDVCRRLDGIPLAIELATARLRALSVEQLSTRLDDCFRLLTMGSHTAPPRHQTLRATVEWSYGLLDPCERSLFDRLSVFAGGATLEATEQVCAESAPDISHADVLDVLTRLVDKSLVVAEPIGIREMRYRLLETLRQYAEDQLAQDSRQQLARAHALFFLSLAERGAAELWTAAQLDWLRRLDLEHDNFRKALRWALDTGAYDVGLRLSGTLAGFWAVRGHMTEGRGWFDRLLVHADSASPPTVARAYHGLGWLASMQDDYAEASARLEQALALYRRLEDADGTAGALNRLGVIARQEGDYSRALGQLEESLDLFRAIGSKRGTANTLSNLGALLADQGDFDRAVPLLEEGLALSKAIGDQFGVALPLRYLGIAAQRQADLARAQELCEDNVRLYKELGWEDGVASASSELGMVCQARGDFDQARWLYSGALLRRQEDNNRWGIADSLERFAALAVAERQLRRAARLCGAADALRAAVGVPLPPAERQAFARTITAARTSLGRTAFEAEWAAGRRLSVEASVQFALADPQPAVMQAGRDLLTRREREVVVLLARGCSNREIARQLCIELSTVERHVANILNKLALRSRSQVAVWAVERRLAPPG